MPRHFLVIALAGLLTGVSAAAGAADGDSFKVPAGLKPLPVPSENPMTAEKVELGKQLYFDTRLSCDETVSCASTSASIRPRSWSARAEASAPR